MDAALDEETSSYASLAGERPALIEPGLYELRFNYHETRVLFGCAPKLVLWFTVISMGPYFDQVQLPRYYNVAKLLGRPGKHGRFKVGFKSDFLREYAALFPARLRLDRIPMSPLERGIVMGQVRTVSVGAKQESIPTVLRYSVIGQLVRLKDDVLPVSAIPDPSPVPVPT